MTLRGRERKLTMPDIPDTARLVTELRRVKHPGVEVVTIDAAVGVVLPLLLEAYTEGVIDGCAMGREEERRQILLPLGS